MIREQDKKHLERLRATFVPIDSLASRIESLTDEQRAAYERRKARYDDWFDRCKAQHNDDINPDANAYANTLDRDPSPRLRRDIDETLFGKVPVITKSMSDFETVRAWMDYLETKR